MAVSDEHYSDSGSKSATPHVPCPRMNRNSALTIFGLMLSAAFVLYGLGLLDHSRSENAQTAEIPVSFIPPSVTNTQDCVRSLSAYLSKIAFYYAPNQWEIAEEDKPKVHEIAKRANQCPDAILYVYGHSDATGNDEINFDVSLRRAEEFKIFIASIDSDGDGFGDFENIKFRLHGRGSSESVFEGDAEDEDQVLNRRLRVEAHYYQSSEYYRNSSP